MKDFFKNRSYDMVKMFLNQFAISLFGLVLAMAAVKRPTLRNVTSVFSILFYLFLLYTMTWELGFKDKNSVDLGKKQRRPLTGLLISLCANIPNFFFATAITLGTFFPNVSFFSKLGGLSAVVALLLEGMYAGVLTNHLWGNPLNSYWWMWFLRRSWLIFFNSLAMPLIKCIVIKSNPRQLILRKVNN